MKKKAPTKAPTDVSVPHPRAHNQLVGHAAQQTLVLESFYSGKMPHAWLISGPKGVGKATFAYRMAAFLCSHIPSSQHASTIQVSAADPIVKHIAQGSSGDILVLEENETGTIAVEEVRKIGHFLHLTASHSPYRIVIIDSADALNNNAANALLKLLEEPPSNCFFFLISHMPGTLLPTIRSRCRMLPMHIQPELEALEIVTTHCPTLSKEQAAKLLVLAEGMAGKAITFYHHKTLDYYQELLAILSILPGHNTQAEYKLAEYHAAKANISAWENFNMLLSRILTFMVKQSAKVPLKGVLPEEEMLVRTLGPQSTLDTWLELWEKVSLTIEEAARANLDLKQVTLIVFDTIHKSITGKQKA